MFSNSNVACAFVAPCRPAVVGNCVDNRQSNVAQAARKLWMALGDHGWVPDFNSDNLGRPLKPHPTLLRQIEHLELLPGWSAVTGQANAHQHFTQVLGEARILAQNMYSMWGTNDALSVLQLAGPGKVTKAYDEGDGFALSACAIAYTLVQADHAVRARLGEVVADELQLVDVLSKVQFLNFNDLAPVIADTNQITGISPTTVVYNSAGTPVLLNIQVNHPDLKPATLLTDVLRLYENQRALASFSIEEIANLLDEPVSERLVASYFTLVNAPFHQVCNSIEAIPEPVFSSFDWGECTHAFEQCCRYFGEEFMLQTTFGKHPSTTHETLFNERLRKILPVMQRFLKGDEVSWS